MLASLLAASIVAQACALVNVKVARHVDISSLAIRTTVDVEVAGPERSYLFVLPKELVDDLAYVHFSSGKADLTAAPTTHKCPSTMACWTVQLPSNVSTFTAVHANTAHVKPWPARDVGLEDPLKLLLSLPQHYPTVYETSEEALFFELTDSTTLLSLKCQDTNAEKRVCGPYRNVNFQQEQHAKEIAKLHIKATRFSPFIVEDWAQHYVVLPWFRTAVVTERMRLRNAAATLKNKGAFSRLDLLKHFHQAKGKVDAPIFPAVPMEFPPSATSLEVRDDIGIIWSRRQERQVDVGTWVTDVAGRYPFVQGWSASWQLAYRLPLGPLRAEQGQKTTKDQVELSIPIGMTMALDGPVGQYAVCVILPEDARYQTG